MTYYSSIFFHTLASISLLALAAGAALGDSSLAPSPASPTTCEATSEALKLAFETLDQGNQLRQTDSAKSRATLQEAGRLLDCIYQKALDAHQRELAGTALFKRAQVSASLQEWSEALRLYNLTYNEFRDLPYVKEHIKELLGSIQASANWLAQVDVNAIDARDRKQVEEHQPPAHPIKHFELWQRGKMLRQWPPEGSHLPPLVVPKDDLTFEVHASGYEDTQLNRRMFLAPQPQKDPVSQLPIPPLYHVDLPMAKLPIYKRWWFWTLVGTSISAAAVGTGVALRPRDPVFSLE